VAGHCRGKGSVSEWEVVETRGLLGKSEGSTVGKKKDKVVPHQTGRERGDRQIRNVNILLDPSR